MSLESPDSKLGAVRPNFYFLKTRKERCLKLDLILFIVFLSLSLILIGLGLFKSEHTELALIGFVFLFLLSMLISSSDIQYKIGTNSTYTYDLLNQTEHLLDNAGNPVAVNSTVAVVTHIHEIDIYETFTANQSLSWLGRTLATVIGYWLAIVSIVGFVGVLMGWRKGAKY